MRVSGIGGEIAGIVKWPGLGLLAYSVLRLLMFLCTFIAARMDSRHERLDEQQARLDKSIADRLTHLEEQERAGQARIAVLASVVEVLLAELRTLDPKNPKLVAVAKALRESIPIDLSIPDDMVTSLRNMP